MKKLLAVLLATLLTMALLAGCGGASDAPVKVEQETAATSGETKPADADTDTVLGRLEDGVYTNSYAGFGCRLEGNWKVRTAGELQELPERVQEQLSGTEYATDGTVPANIYDLQAENETDRTFFSVMYNRLDDAMKKQAQSMSDEDMVDVTLSQKDQMIQTYGAVGIEVSKMEKVKVSFLGAECAAVKTTATVRGTSYYTVQIMCLGRGEYLVTLTLGSFGEDRTDRLLELFYKV